MHSCHLHRARLTRTCWPIKLQIFCRLESPFHLTIVGMIWYKKFPESQTGIQTGFALLVKLAQNNVYSVFTIFRKTKVLKDMLVWKSCWNLQPRRTPRGFLAEHSTAHPPHALLRKMSVDFEAVLPIIVVILCFMSLMFVLRDVSLFSGGGGGPLFWGGGS